MVIVKIWGGLGNQMFQYAAARQLALRLRKKLALDLSPFRGVNPRPYQLDRFKIKGGVLSKRRKRWETEMKSPRRARLRRILRMLPGAWVHEVFVDDLRGSDDHLKQLTGNLYLEGFWQDERYFADIRDTLLEDFTFKQPPDPRNGEILARIESENAVCVHVRRGDYVAAQLENFGVCGVDYYLRALDCIRGKIANPVFYVFSDEPGWVAANFPRLDNLRIISHNTGGNDPEDLRLMMHCRHFIVANSSFSWWGAWLGRSPEKIVIAPKVWFVSPKFGNHRAPVSWLRL